MTSINSASVNFLISAHDGGTGGGYSPNLYDGARAGQAVRLRARDPAEARGTEYPQVFSPDRSRGCVRLPRHPEPEFPGRRPPSQGTGHGPTARARSIRRYPSCPRNDPATNVSAHRLLPALPPPARTAWTNRRSTGS